MRVGLKTILLNGDMSSATVTSDTIDLTAQNMVSIQAVWSGSPVGSIGLEFTNSLAGTPTWTPVDDTAQDVNGAGSYGRNCYNIAYPYLRVVYTKTSGTGILNASAYNKGF